MLNNKKELVLEPCPFCGGEAEIIRNYKTATQEYEYMAWCTELGCNANIDGFVDEESAIKAWNTRKPMERILEQLEEKALEHAINGQQYSDDEYDNIANEEINKRDCYLNAVEIVQKGGAE